MKTIYIASQVSIYQNEVFSKNILSFWKISFSRENIS